MKLLLNSPVEVVCELYVCENCGTEWEDAAADLMWETLEQIGKCVGCATTEEIKEYGNEKLS